MSFLLSNYKAELQLLLVRHLIWLLKKLDLVMNHKPRKAMKCHHALRGITIRKPWWHRCTCLWHHGKCEALPWEAYPKGGNYDGL